MRQAVITISWEGPDKKVRDVISDALDNLFMEITFLPAVTAGNTTIKFTSRLK